MGGTRDRKLVIKEMKPVYRRLKSKNGETLVETLAATLLVSLAMIAFSVMLSTTANIITSSRDTINNYIKSGGSNIDGKLTVYRDGSNKEIKFTDEQGASSIDIKANKFEHGIVSYHKNNS